ncbi:hypothetical protein KDL01_09655 [Actinospica durhamensis]|uniref:SalK n=1 Tax=Actinospica durhamensis TaxID=1508375 RepID=A0A941ISR9_9ACTN|nr:hypothetical protein [Actinospica durhamensis]MBR7833531.1 hypothetical protein [Actinospica durhamensis]
MSTHPARRLWHSLEALYQPALLVDDTRDAGAALGLRGFWMAFLAFRAAPLGAVSAATATAAFGGFAPGKVAKAIPGAWATASPADCVASRNALAGKLLRSAGVTEEAAAPLVERLAALPAALEPTGRPLGAANAALPLPEDPIAALWQLAGTVREYRGDGHVASWVAAGVSGLESHHLLTAGRAADVAMMREIRGWTAEEWSAAAEALTARGLLDATAGTLTDTGLRLRAQVERQTDELSWSGGMSVLGEDGVAEICAALAPVVRSVRDCDMAPLLTLLAPDVDEA